MSTADPKAPGSVSAVPIYLMAFASGFAALVYQVAWSSMLSLTFGSATLAVSSVVAGFMGGMGIGAWLYNRVSARVGDAMRAYAALEISIALSTAALTAVLDPLPWAFASVSASIPAGFLYDLFRVGTVFLLLLIPSALMGATYPALCTALIHTRDEVDRHLGMIYGLNTVGAAAGALVAGFAMAETLGLHGSVHVANLINLSVGGWAAWVAWRLARKGRRVPLVGRDEAIPTAFPYWLTGAVLVGSGFATLAYEIVWFRALRYLVGNSTYALTDVLVIFLLGLGLGALLLRPVLRIRHPERTLGWVQLLTAVLALAAIRAEELVLSRPELQHALSIFSPAFRAHPWPERLLVTTTTALAIMLPATLLMGLTFPLASRLYIGNVRAVGRRAGFAYLLANLGSIAGAIGAAIVILPHLGTVGGTRALAAVNLALGIIVLFRAPGTRAHLAPAALVLGGAAALMVTLPPRLPFGGGTFVRRLLPQLIFEEEGDLATVQVRQNPRRRSMRAMEIDGVMIAASPNLARNFSEKQRVLAHLPKIIDRHITRTLNVGLASGATTAAMATYPDVKLLDVVEINAPVKRAVHYFKASAVLRDPRTHLVIDDAVHYLLRTSDRYDLIISDGKQNPDFSGNEKILSREFYDFSLARLTKCGIFIQWIPLDTFAESMQIILRTFLSAFPQAEFFVSPPSNLYMLGSRCPIAGRQELDEATYRSLPVARQLTQVGFQRPDDLLALWVASGSQVRARLPAGPINRWDRMVLSYLAYRASPEALGRSSIENMAFFLGLANAPPTVGTRDFRDAHPEAWQRAHQILEADLLEKQGDLAGAARLVGTILAEDPENVRALELRAVIRARTGSPPG